MRNLSRRGFIKLGGFATAIGLHRTIFFTDKSKLKRMCKAVKFTRDGVDFTPFEYSVLLEQLADQGKIGIDSYSRGGVVEELEYKFAKWLGKERAIFMPTGTLANHIAVRSLAQGKNRIIVQDDSHIYNDSGDCCQTLSGLNLIPIKTDKKGFTLKQVKEVISQTFKGRVKTGVGVISIESPVRRKNNRMFDFEEMKKISKFARDNNIKLHLDGARIFIASAHTGIHPSEYSALFDTVYTSLYKCFNAASGAVLAGPEKVIKDLYHTRRMFGGGMPQAWPFAAVALEYVDTFIDEYKLALINFKKFENRLARNNVFRIEKIHEGTNVFKLKVRGIDPEKFRSNLRKRNIFLPEVRKRGVFYLKINTTLNRADGNSLAEEFIGSL